MSRKYTGAPRRRSGAIAGMMLTLTLGAILVRPAHAQNYPARTIKIVVPFPAGGTADVMPRIFADWLSRKWGQPVVVEDRAGPGAISVPKSSPNPIPTATRCWPRRRRHW